MPEDAGGEELLETRQRTPSRRVRLVLGAVAASAVVVVGVVVLTRDGDDRPVAVPTSTVPTSAPISVSSVPRPVCLDVGDSALNCGVSSRLPAALLLAARTVLPKATVVTATTVTGRDGRVFSRRVLMQGEAGSTLLIRIGPVSGQRVDPNVNGVNDGLATEYFADVGRRHIEVSVRTLPGRTPPTRAAVQRLALDPRLLTVR